MTRRSLLMPARQDALGRGPRGQAMVEFALVVGLFATVIGGVMQFGMLLWSQNTVTQVARDTARWAATQPTSPCDSASNRSALAATAGTLGARLNLLGYRSGTWITASTVDATPAEGVGADWPLPTPPPTLVAEDCPPSDNQTAWFVRVRVNHVVPIFFPGLQFIAPPCSASGFCLSSTAELRMEPKPP